MHSKWFHSFKLIGDGRKPTFPGRGLSPYRLKWADCKPTSLKLPIPYVRKMPLNGGCSRHHGAHQVSSPAASLPTFKIAVAGRGAPFPWLQDVGIHTEAHRTSRFPPFEPGIEENPIEAFLLRRTFHGLGTRHHHRPHLRTDSMPFGYPGGRTQIFN